MKPFIIILGLPGSGKTTYAKTIKTHKLYDDCLFNFYSRELTVDIVNKNNIILVDPRFCDIDILFKYIAILSHQNIELIVFDNDIEQVKNNLDQSKTHHKISNKELDDFHYKYTLLLESIEFKYLIRKIKTSYKNVYKCL